MSQSQRLIAALILGASLSLGACSTAEISVDRDAAIVIPAASSYSWGKLADVAAPTPDTADFDNDIVRRRLQSAINAELQRQGLLLSEQSTGRFEVSYHIGVIRKKATEISRDMPMVSPMVRCGARTCWSSLNWGYMGPPLETVREYEYREGSLIIDVRESDSGRLAWRGVYRDTLRNAGPITDETISKIVTQTLKGLVQ